jgi:hypothetical protein
MESWVKSLLGMTLALLVARSASPDSVLGLLGSFLLSLMWFAYGIHYLGKDYGWWD